MVTLILLIHTTQDYSTLLITVFSIIFTMISILMSCFEYFLSSKFVSFASSIIISFCIESDDIVNMSHKEFQSSVVFRRNKLIESLAKLLKLRYEQVERLKPKKTANGAIFLFAIAIDVSQIDNIKQQTQQLVNNGKLSQVCCVLHASYNSHLHSVNEMTMYTNVNVVFLYVYNLIVF